MTADELYETTMNPENRRLIQLTTNDLQKSLNLYSTLMGDSPEARRGFIMNSYKKRNLFKNSADDYFDDDSGDAEDAE